MQGSLLAVSLLVAASLAIAGSAQAAASTGRGEAHICTTRAFLPVAPMNDSKYKYLPLNDSTVFKCPAGIGDKTIPQLAAAGWRFDMPLTLTAGPAPIVITNPPLVEWKILIHKP